MRWQVAGLVVGIMLGVAQPGVAGPALPMVHSLQYDPATQRLVLTATGDVMPQVTQLSDPPRIVVDFPGQGITARQLAGWLPAIKGVRLAQFQPEVGRLVFDVDQPMNLEIERQKTADGTVQVFFRVVAAAVSSDNQLQAIDINGDTLQLTAAQPVQPVLTQSGGRMSLQIPHLRASTLAKVPLASDLFEHLTAVEKDGGFVLQATLSRPEPLTVSLSENGRVVTLAPRAPWARLDVVARNEPKEAALVLKGDKRFTYQIERSDNRILLTTSGTYTEERRKTFADGVIKEMRIGPGEEPGTTLIAIETHRPAGYGVGLTDDGQTLKLALKSEGKQANVPAARQGAPLIVLDPGHGGHDPGAIGPGGTREAHVTLAVIGYLREELEQMGWKVSLARHDDSEIDLAPRVATANSQSADLFVSVHCNSLDRNWVKGIETYYRNPFSLGLAQTLHAALVGNLGSPDRGVRYANFYVIHHTTMPSVLCEIGYLSNPDEERKLRDVAYQRKVARSIAQGLKTYWAKSNK